MIQKYYFKLLFLWCRFMHEDLETAKIEELTLAIKNCKVFVYCLFFSFIYDNFWVCFFIIWKLFLKESGKIDIPHNLLQIQWSNQSIDLRGKRYCIAIHLICMLYLNTDYYFPGGCMLCVWPVWTRSEMPRHVSIYQGTTVQEVCNCCHQREHGVEEFRTGHENRAAGKGCRASDILILKW